MLYPIYVHSGDKNTAYGISFPDFAGCFSAADTWEQISACTQEAVEAHFADGEAIPKATPLEHLIGNPAYEGGAWMLVDIDLNRVNKKTIRLNVSLPENLVYQIDDFSKKKHMSRSAFLAQAATVALNT